MIEGRVHIQLRCLNGMSLTGTAVRYSDPHEANGYGTGAFHYEGVDGSKSYVPWAAILYLNVFDLSTGQAPPELPADTQVTP